MALSQIQCLDNNHVNPRTHESKPEFFYCEDQRLALEALLRDGREAFHKYLDTRGLRGFLSDPELETLTGVVEPYDPGSELLQGDSQDERSPLSLHYWPDLSDTSVPQMDLGWPDCDAYRGVTRTTVYTQPPLDGHAHIKEVVRKMIAQAQKVIGVVMDVFTDVDIFRDLLDAGFKRRISVYILLERTTLPHFLSMCRRANMHGGHLKHLRVRCTEGSEFYTRSCMKVRGRMGHRLMFIDGDKAVSGSYSFTWMSSRLDRNLITVVTGQAVEGFDRLFRILYATSRSVDLRQVAVEPEPKADPLPQAVTVAPPSAAVARKLYNPKYALVAGSNPSHTASVGRDKEPQTLDVKTRNRRGTAAQEAPPLHPGLMNLEKACLITYLPTWPEPDPPSDVIGFINIRDASKPTQVHLQRSEMFETSQAIRFSSPITKPQEVLPEVAKPRHEGAEPAKDQPEPEKETTPQSDGKLETNTADKRDTRQHTPQHTTDTLSACRDAPDGGQTSLRSDSVCRTHTSEPTNTSSTAERSKTPPLPLPSSSVVLSPPIPKPRTVQLLIKDSGSGDGRTLPEICMVRKSEDCDQSTSAGKDDPNPEEMKTEDAAGRQDGAAATQSDVWVVQEITPKGGDETSAACKTGGSSSVHRVSSTSEDTLTTTKTYLARAQAPQRISYSELTAQEVSEAASAHTPVPPSHHAVDVNSAPSKKSLCLHLSDTHLPDLRTPERETRSLSRLARTPTPDGLPPRTPTPDSRTATPDPRTPTPDGYVSTREDSARSTTSEEYYECSDSPLHDSVFDHVDYHDVSTMEDHVTTAAATAKVREEEERKLSVKDAEEADTDSHLRKDQLARGTEGEPTNEGGETTPLSNIKGSEAPRGGVENQEALRPSGAETSRESEKTPLKLQEAGGGGVSSSRPLRSLRPLSASQAFGPRPWGKEGRTLSAGLQDNASSPRRPPSRLPPPAAGSIGSTGGGRKQVAQTPQSPPPRQPAAAQSRAGAGQYPKPPASFLHTHSNLQLSPQSQAVSGQEAPGKQEGRAPFGFTFSRLYSLKGLKDKMNKLPSQSRKSSGGSAGRKSSS